MRRCFEARQAFLEKRALRVRKDPSADEADAGALTPPRAQTPEGSSVERAISIGTPSPASAIKLRTRTALGVPRAEAEPYSRVWSLRNPLIEI